MGFPCGSAGKETACKAGDLSSIPRLGRSSGEGKGYSLQYLDFPGGSDGEASAYNVGDPDLIPGSRRSSGEGNGNPLQYSCLETRQRSLVATLHRVTKSQT